MLGVAGRRTSGLQKRASLSTAPALGSSIFMREGASSNAQATRRTLHLGVVLMTSTAAFSSTAALSTCDVAATAAAGATMRKDENGLWWRGEGEADGPYVLKSDSSSPPLSPSSSAPASTACSDDDFKKIPFTVDEILPLARELAISCNVAALSTVSEESPGQLFPRYVIFPLSLLNALTK